MDVIKDGRTQFDYLLLFAKIPEERLRSIYKLTDISTDWTKFLQMYRQATSDPHDFLYVNRNDEEYRKNFNQQFV